MKNILSSVGKILSGKRTFGQAFNYLKCRRHPQNKSTVNYQPIRLGIFTSYTCNLHCDMCLTHSTKIPENPYKYQGAREMDFPNFKDIVDRFRNTLHASFIGNGEPLLCKDLFKMFWYAREKRKMATSMFTNGLVLDRFVDDILDSPLDTINVSVNGHIPEVYKHFTGHSEAVFERILSNVNLLVEKKGSKSSHLEVSISLIVDRFTYKQIPEMIHFAEQLGVDCLSICQCMPSKAPGWSAAERALFTTDEVLTFFAQIKPPRTRLKVSLPSLLDGNENNRLCRDSFISMSIDGDGNVGGCERQMLNTTNNGKYYAPNVFNNDHFMELRSLFLSNTLPLPEPCRTCYNNTTYPGRLLIGENR
jgi:MoaA/NifB/PqqE/SkfB family radical SAM enzyme